MLLDHITCPHCAYDLAGQSAAGRCPECGMAVMDALRSFWIRFQPPAAIGRLGRTMIGCGVAMILIWGVVIWGGLFAIDLGIGLVEIVMTIAWVAMLLTGGRIVNRSAYGAHMPAWTRWARAYGWLTVLMLGCVVTVGVMRFGAVEEQFAGVMLGVWAVNAVGMAAWVVGLLLAVVILMRRLPSDRTMRVAGLVAGLAVIALAAALLAGLLKVLGAPRIAADLPLMLATMCGGVLLLALPPLLMLAGWRILLEVGPARRILEMAEEQ